MIEGDNIEFGSTEAWGEKGAWSELCFDAVGTNIGEDAFVAGSLLMQEMSCWAALAPKLSCPCHRYCRVCKNGRKRHRDGKNTTFSFWCLRNWKWVEPRYPSVALGVLS